MRLALGQNDSILLDMAHYGNQILCAPDSMFDSLVITHGTGVFCNFILCIDLAADT
jgi:predicted nuclease of predicted toxin-antitoxin system